MAQMRGQRGKRHGFLHGALVLTAGMAVVKVLGALFKVPLTYAIGSSPLGRWNDARQVKQVAMPLFLGVGALGLGAMACLAPLYCRWVTGAAYALAPMLALAPAVLLAAFAAAFTANALHSTPVYDSLKERILDQRRRRRAAASPTEERS